MYVVETESIPLAQVDVLPSTALAGYAELLVLLEVDPWSGEPFSRERPDGNVRTRHFGETSEGLVSYLILDRQRRVIVLKVLWIG